MASSSENWPPHQSVESDGSSNDVSPSEGHRAAQTQENEPTRPTITAIRIPADGALPYLTTLQLVKATPDYHYNLYDPDPSQYSDFGDFRDVHRHSSLFLNPKASDAQIDIRRLYDSIESVSERAHRFYQDLGRVPRLFADANRHGPYKSPEVPLAERTKEPHMTFTHASLRLQPSVVDSFWGSGEAWNQRAFKRLYAVSREEADLEMMTSEYHIMYTLVEGESLLPNKWARKRVFGDAFVLKMASKKNGDGDWYYEDMPQEIMHCSLGNQCLETLRSLRPVTWKTMVGQRGDGPPGVISPGMGLRGMYGRPGLCRLIL